MCLHDYVALLFVNIYILSPTNSIMRRNGGHDKAGPSIQIVQLSAICLCSNCGGKSYDKKFLVER